MALNFTSFPSQSRRSPFFKISFSILSFLTSLRNRNNSSLSSPVDRISDVSSAIRFFQLRFGWVEHGRLTQLQKRCNLALWPVSLFLQVFLAISSLIQSRKAKYGVLIFTYLKTRQGWVYLAIVMDLYSRKIVGTIAVSF